MKLNVNKLARTLQHRSIPRDLVTTDVRRRSRIAPHVVSFLLIAIRARLQQMTIESLGLKARELREALRRCSQILHAPELHVVAAHHLQQTSRDLRRLLAHVCESQRRRLELVAAEDEFVE
eukprot:CAMPEP_0198111088 /NCGR_PEP_ID=MMETSP1442-20131203/3075_1 /TAXON_ID= /ORGANISM="Craspedostauros australis, Strain CCMP3328" /LENGTH=120 /DNA_ID=CAMNT_0043767395 /DNA_START=77 /DNA_END=439 /DNA_ORIENTATION=+